MEDNKEKKQLGKIEVLKTLSDQQDALREIATSPEQPKERAFDVEKTDGETFYQNAFGLTVDFTEVKVPSRPGLERNFTLIAVEKRLTLEKILATNKTECLIRINPLISLEGISSPYFTNRAYMVWAADDLRPDLRIMNQRNTAGKRIMTVEERILFGIKRFINAREGQSKYYDMEMPTLTSSYVDVRRDTKAIVVRFQNGGIYIDIQDRHTPGGAREVFGIE